MVKNLSKENFFNDLRTTCPLAVDDFCKWVDKFKLMIGWDKIFKCNEATGQLYKFHDLPLELQTGIIGRYIVEQMASIPENGVENYERSAGQEHRQHLTDMFKQIQVELEKRQISQN